MNAARPITEEEYKKFRTELYKFSQELGREALSYEVPLDADPTMQPRNMNEKLSLVQAFKDRVVMILNRAILAESYWKTRMANLNTKFEAECSRAMITDEVKTAKSSEVREALSAEVAGKKIVKMLKGDDTKSFEDFLISYSSQHSDALAFLREIQNIYDNLQSTSMQLAVQLKSVAINAKVYGDGALDPLAGQSLR